MNTPMLPTPPDCGNPCATCEALAHDNARLREQIGKPVLELLDRSDVADANVALLRAEIERWRDSNNRLRSEMEHQSLRANTAEADLASVRHDLSVAQNWVEHHSKHADDLIAVNVALRAALDPERLIAAIALPGGHYCDPQAVADAIRAYCATQGGAK